MRDNRYTKVECENIELRGTEKGELNSFLAENRRNCLTTLLAWVCDGVQNGGN